MEESMMSVYQDIKKDLGLKERDARSFSPLTLAYIGDAVYELIVRSYLVSEHDISPHDFQVESAKLVNAVTQADMVKSLMPYLTEEEEQILRRGRNAKSNSTAKNAPVIDYRYATGFEALIGYLYLTGEDGRIRTLVKKSIDHYYGRKPDGQ
ncbi:MAG: ribonuclease III [Lachnospiraceae bacterium]|nr:ribonuclease III [Lachnospiraceae bacterium]